MSFEKAVIANAQKHLIATKARDVIGNEISKGCRPEILLLPVSLEPCFQPIWNIRNNPALGLKKRWVLEGPASQKDIIRLRVWISSEQKFEWNQSELFIKQLQGICYRVVFELTGNNKGFSI